MYVFVYKNFGLRFLCLLNRFSDRLFSGLNNVEHDKLSYFIRKLSMEFVVTDFDNVCHLYFIFWNSGCVLVAHVRNERHFDWSIRWTFFLFVPHTHTLTYSIHCNTFWKKVEEKTTTTFDWRRTPNIVVFLLLLSSLEFMTLSPIKNIRRLNFMMLTYRLKLKLNMSICVSTNCRVFLVCASVFFASCCFFFVVVSVFQFQKLLLNKMRQSHLRRQKWS